MAKRKKKKVSIEKEYEPYKDISDYSEERICQYINENKLSKKKIEKLVEVQNELIERKKKVKKVKFTINMVPKGSPRPRINMFTKSIYVEGAKKNREFFNRLVETNKINIGDMIYTATKMKIKFYLPMPNTMSHEEKIMAERGLIRPTVKPDWDNLGKTTDMFNDKLWIDDSLVVESTVKKFYSFKPRIEVTIKYEEYFDSKYNMNRILKSKHCRPLFKSKKKRKGKGINETKYK